MDDKSNELKEHSALARGLAHLHESLGEVETAASKLKNQNFADLIKAARGRLSQAMEHADLPEVDKILSADPRANEHKAGAPFPGADDDKKD